VSDVLRRADELLEMGQTVLNTRYRSGGAPYSLDYVKSAAMAGFRSACLSFIERVYGSTHPHFMEFLKTTQGDDLSSVEEGVEILPSSFGRHRALCAGDRVSGSRDDRTGVESCGRRKALRLVESHEEWNAERRPAERGRGRGAEDPDRQALAVLLRLKGGTDPPGAQFSLEARAAERGNRGLPFSSFAAYLSLSASAGGYVLRRAEGLGRVEVSHHG
jgi:hypothetical protein